MEAIQIKDEDVIVKRSICSKCQGLVRVAVKNTMDAKSKREFAKEVFQYNLSVSEISLEDFHKEKSDWCSCD